jgi:HK97 family phage major capsid protein/HK97 family phage prohead protease
MPDELIRQKELFRRFLTNDLFEIRKTDGKGRTLHFAASSEYPVERWYGMEILSHAKNAVKLDRAANGAMPLLFNHDINDPIGMITKAELSGGRLMVDAALFETGRAAEVQTMIDGGLRNVSLAYRVNVLEEDTHTKIFTATDWSPYEVSIVTVPADPTVGIGRGSDTLYDMRMIRSTNHKETTMAEIPETRSAVLDETDRPIKLNPVEVEKQRREGIENLCKANKLPEETRDHWISEGTSMNVVAKEMLGIMEERGRLNPQSVTKLGLSDKETKQFNLCRAIDACGMQNWSTAGFEAECSHEIAKRLGRSEASRTTFFVPLEIQSRDLAQRAQRDLTVATGSAGGFLVETANVGFIELLRNRSVIMAMGATRLSGLQGNVAIPKQTTAGTVTWLANEASTITETNQVFAQVALTPKTVGGYTEISRLLLLQSNPSAQQIVMNDLAAIVAIAVDLAGLTGSGASGQPTGIINTAGIGGVTGTSIAYAGIIEFQTDVATGNALTGNCGYVTTPAVAGLLKQRVKFTSTASPLWEGQLLDGTVDGYRAIASNQVPAANILFGDFGTVIVGEWSVLELEINPYANFQAGIVGVRAIYTVDIGVRYPSAFSLATSVT